MAAYQDSVTPFPQISSTPDHGLHERNLSAPLINLCPRDASLAAPVGEMPEWAFSRIAAPMPLSNSVPLENISGIDLLPHIIKILPAVTVCNNGAASSLKFGKIIHNL